MLDKVYFALSLVFIAIGAVGIFLPEVPGMISAFCGVLIFALLTQFRDIRHDFILKYAIATGIIWYLNTYLKNEKEVKYHPSLIFFGTVSLIVFLITKNYLLPPVIIVLGHIVIQTVRNKKYIKEISTYTRGLVFLWLEIFFYIAMSYEFIIKVVSRF